MSPLDHQTEPDEAESSRTGRFVLIGLIVVGCGIAAYLSMPPVEQPAPVTDAADPPPPAPRPAPEPEPEPLAPPPATEPEPEPEVAAETALPPAPPQPRLRVASDVPGAAVFLDRKYLGTTPFETAEVPPGPHRLNVSVEGHDTFARNIDIGDRLVAIDVRFLEIRFGASVAVVHEHRFGSCEGVLRADLDGIRYDITSDDAFSIPLAEIERHEIDYLGHTLTLKRREGRTYNFTDAQDTADALFVFHRDVEQARERLAAR